MYGVRDLISVALGPTTHGTGGLEPGLCTQRLEPAEELEPVALHFGQANKE